MSANGSVGWDIVQDATHVYWSEEGVGVSRWSKSDGQSEVLVSVDPEDHVGIIALDENHLYWNVGGELSRKSMETEAVELLASGVGSPRTLAIDAEHVYWDYSSNVARVPKNGGDVEILAEGLDLPSGIALSNSHVYWANQNTGEVVRLAKSGGEVEILATGQKAPNGIVLDGTDLYWSTYSNETSSGPDGSLTTTTDAIMRLSESGEIEQVTDSAGPIAQDETYIYWTSFTANTVERMRKDTDEVELIATGQEGAGGIALDDSHVYWTTRIEGQVMRQALNP